MINNEELYYLKDIIDHFINNQKRIDAMENQTKEFVKFEKPGDFFEGIVRDYVKTKFGVGLVLETETGNVCYLGINLHGLKKVFYQAMQNEKFFDLTFRKIKITFLNEIELESGNSFFNFSLKIFAESGNFYEFISNNYERISVQEFKQSLG